ncbi:MAG: porphobilinogen synthase [Candidatus Omnitrophota bacterium]
MRFPQTRLRRLRQNDLLRRLVKETTLHPDNLIYPLFVIDGRRKKQAIKAMPGIYRFSIDNLLKELELIAKMGILAILLFGIPDKKDAQATGAYDENGIVQQAVRAIKKEKFPLLVVTDVCLCEYTDHGHCGVVKNYQSGQEHFVIDNDESVKLISRTALSHARAGADIVAPSDMMDGRVKHIRMLLDKNGFEHTAIMSYAAKYASAFYGPFRDAANSCPAFGDRRTHQMDIANVKEALREVQTDINEGADIVMVKPALAYLDVIFKIKDKFHWPTAAYNVSAEYSMVKAAANNHWVDYRSIVIEILTAIKRAGADMIISYHAKDVVAWIK